MNVFASLQARLAEILRAEIAAGALPEGLDLSRFVVEPPRESAHGDLSTNAAMVYAKEAKAAGSNPRALAEKLVAALRAEPELAAKVGAKLFPPEEASLVTGLIRRDLPYYDADISPAFVAGMNGFARDVGILSGHPRYEQVVATQFAGLWKS